jgi:hypothetical protein
MEWYLIVRSYRCHIGYIQQALSTRSSRINIIVYHGSYFHLLWIRYTSQGAKLILSSRLYLPQSNWSQQHRGQDTKEDNKQLQASNCKDLRTETYLIEETEGHRRKQKHLLFNRITATARRGTNTKCIDTDTVYLEHKARVKVSINGTRPCVHPPIVHTSSF